VHILPWLTEYSETTWDQSLNRRLDEMQFDFIIDTERSPAANLAVDETLLYRVAKGERRPLFRMWEWLGRSVILGSYQSVSDEFDAEVAAQQGYIFERRISGGGAMVVEADKTITWSLIVPESVLDGLSFRQSFAFLDMWCVRALRSLGIPATYRPINDIASPLGKIAGAAQCRRQRTVLHHSTMAFDLDVDVMWKLLRLQQPRLNSKSVASAVKHVSPLNTFVDLPYHSIRHILCSAFAGMYQTTPSAVSMQEDQLSEELICGKYATRDWRYRVT
jgi:lipoate---protein ligase